MEVNYIPEEFRFSHDFCFFLHDILVDIIKSGEAANIFNISIHIRSEQDAQVINSKHGEELWKWLEEHGYKEDVLLLSYKQVCVAMLSDFCHFVHEALQCSRKGKLTVTFALLRKPFKENLLFLEWLLADPVDFLKHFRYPEMGQLFNRAYANEARRLEIIQQAIEKTKYKEWLHAEFIARLRYDKNAHYGLEPLLQKAMHLITTFKSIKTEEQNFNFVFSNDEDRYEQWAHLYSILPLLLFHTVQIVETLVATFATRVDTENDITEHRVLVGLALWIQDAYYDPETEELCKDIRIAIDNEPLQCPECHEKITFEKDNLYSFYNEGTVTCKGCQHTIDFLSMNDEK